MRRLGLVIIFGFIIFRRKAKVNVELPGSKLKFEGSNRSTTSDSDSKKRSNGIFGNFSIGRTRMKLKGRGTIANNKSVGDTELIKEDIPSGKSHKSK